MKLAADVRPDSETSKFLLGSLLRAWLLSLMVKAAEPLAWPAAIGLPAHGRQKTTIKDDHTAQLFSHFLALRHSFDAGFDQKVLAAGCCDWRGAVGVAVQEASVLSSRSGLPARSRVVVNILSRAAPVRAL